MEPYKLSLITALVALLFLAYSSKSKIAAKLAIILISVSIFFGLCYFIIEIFSSGGLNVAALNHLHYALDPGTVLKFWRTALLAGVGIVSIAVFAFLVNRHVTGLGAKGGLSITLTASILAVFFAGASVYFNPITVDGIKLFEQHQYAKRTTLPVGLNTVDQLAPPLRAVAPDTKNNFILIFAEGYESAYLDEAIYPGLTPKLNQLIATRGKRIRGMKDLVLTNWTHGGMSAATCGLPMVPEYSDDNPSALTSTTLVGETCTGDILSRDGYQLSFFGGSQFGGEDKYRLYQSQGYKQTNIQEEFAEIFDEDTPTSTWGYYDEKVLDYVKTKFIDSVDNNLSGEPIGFVVLTLDSHQPGLPSPGCASMPYEDGEEPILNGVHCADTLISSFIQQVLDNPSTADTTIFLMSDHLHARPPEKLDAIPRSDRDYLLVTFNAHKNTNFNADFTRHASAMDVAPTFLATLGYEVDTFNLGRNLFKPNKTLAEALGRESLYANIAPIRAQLREHWKKITGVTD